MTGGSRQHVHHDSQPQLGVGYDELGHDVTRTQVVTQLTANAEPKAHTPG